MAPSFDADVKIEKTFMVLLLTERQQTFTTPHTENRQQFRLFLRNIDIFDCISPDISLLSTGLRSELEQPLLYSTGLSVFCG